MWKSIAWIWTSGLRLRSAQSVRITDWDDDRIRGAIRGGWLNKNRPLHIVLEQTLLLKKALSFPKLAKKDLKRAVDVQLRQSLPANGTGMEWRVGKPSRNGKQLTVEVLIARASDLAVVERQAAELGRPIDQIVVGGTPGPILFRESKSKGLKSGVVWALLAALGVGVALFAEFRPQFAELMLLEQRRDALNAEVGDAIALLERETAAIALTSSAVEEQQDDLRRLSLESSRLPLLSELTQALGSDTWVSDLRIEGATARLSAFSTSEVPQVLDSIEEVKFVQSVRLFGSISFDSQSRSQRFEVELVLKRPDQEGSP